MITESTFIMNECLRTEHTPDAWKAGTITPLPKGSNISLDPGDWRTVSVLPLPSKVIERIVYNQLVYYFESYGLLFHNQHGFRMGKSTTSAITEFVQFLYENYDRRLDSSCVYVDYSRAFDTINHEILCKTLHMYGLDNNSLRWCCDYLSNRKQHVKLDDCMSDYLPVKIGVPQGSIIGPFLFVVYINDLITEFGNGDSDVTLYADDTILYTADSNVEHACERNQISVDTLLKWCTLNRLSVNTKKTKHMLVESNVANLCATPPKIRIANDCLENVSVYNYLGVLIDNVLAFRQFVDDKYNKVNFKVYQLKRIRPYITGEIACQIYKQTILPLMDYGDFMIESGPIPRVRRLEKLQLKALKYIDNHAHLGEDEDALYRMYHVQPLSLRWREHIACLMYRLSKDPTNVELRRPKVNLRSNKKVQFKRRQIRQYELYLKSPLSRGGKIWDMLTAEMQRATTKVKFKMLVHTLCV